MLELNQVLDILTNPDNKGTVTVSALLLSFTPKEPGDFVAVYFFPGCIAKVDGRYAATAWNSVRKKFVTITCSGSDLVFLKAVKCFTEKQKQAEAFYDESQAKGPLIDNALITIRKHAAEFFDTGTANRLLQFLGHCLSAMMQGRTIPMQVFVTVASNLNRMIDSINDPKYCNSIKVLLETIRDYRVLILERERIVKEKDLVTRFKDFLTKNRKQIEEREQNNAFKEQTSEMENALNDVNNKDKTYEEVEKALQEAHAHARSKVMVVLVAMTEREFANVDEIAAMGKQFFPAFKDELAMDKLVIEGLKDAAQNHLVEYYDALEMWQLTEDGKELVFSAIENDLRMGLKGR